MSPTRGVDVAVIGGGPAGAAAAVTLRAAGADVAVIAGPGVRTTPRARVAPAQSAPPGTDRVVRDIFGAEGFDEHAHLRSLGNRSVWGSDDLVLTDFMFNPFGTGWHLDRAAFDARLLDRARAMGVEVLDAALVAATFDGGWALDVRDSDGSRELRAGTVCDASGRHAVVARAHGARVVHGDRLVAVGCVEPRAAGDVDLTSTVEAVADGWWYTAPRPNGEPAPCPNGEPAPCPNGEPAPCPNGGRAFVFFTDPDLLDRATTATRDGFARRLAATRCVGALHTGIADTTTPTVFPAGTAHLESPIGQGWIAAGDAAATFDPLSSQGILTALVSGRDAGNALLGSLPDYPARWRRILRDYTRERASWYASETRFSDEAFWRRRRDTRAA